MPNRIYCYSFDEEIIERTFPVGEAPDEIVMNQSGEKAFRNRQAEVLGLTTCVKGCEDNSHHRGRSSPWPMEPCVASGVGPQGAQELREHFTAQGVSTEVSKDGEPIYTSAAHRKKALKCRGMHDRNSYS